MKYVKDFLSEKQIDNMRLNLSVQSRKLSAEPVCDFCGTDKPMWVYASYKMSSGDMKDCWRWCACSACSHLVDNDRWKEIEDKIVMKLGRMHAFARPYYHRAAVLALEEFHLYAIRVEEKK